MNFKPHKNLIKTINVILVIMFALCGCTQKPPEVEPDIPIEPETISEDELRDFPEGYPELSDEPGNSAAFAYSPLEGFYVEAEENAFWEDTNITMKPAEKVSETVFNTMNGLIEEGVYPIGVYEVDAGLDEHDVIPGEYKVSVDPAVFDIDPSLYPCIRVYRLNEDGGYYECATEYTDGKIVYHANQNSVLFYSISAAIALATVATGYILEEQRPLEYFYENNKKSYYASERKNEYASYRLLYSMEDMDKGQAAIADRMEEISQSYEKKAAQIFTEYWEDLNNEKDEVQRLIKASKLTKIETIIEDALNADSEFQQLKSQLYTPEIITMVAEYTDLAFAYLKEQEKVKMPLFVVDIICTPRSGDPSQAESTTRNVLHAGYVELNLAKVLQGNNDARYNLLLTMTHEILHVCQERYRYFFADAIRYDEMVAADMEQRCWDYFVSQGVIPEGLNLELAPTNCWCTLRNSINSNPDEEKNKELLKQQGYFLSNFIKYLVERTGKRPDAGTLMNARCEIAEPGVTEPLKGVFKIPEKEMDAHFTTFVRKNREKLASRYNSKDYEFYYYDPIELVKGGKYRVDIGHYLVEQGNVRSAAYSSYIVGFKQPDKQPMTLLLVLDDRIHFDLPELLVIPFDKYKTFGNGRGAYIGALDADTLNQNHMNRNILHIHGYYKNKLDEKSSGYTLYALDKTGKVAFSEDEDNLIIQMPKNSVAAADRVVEGYLLKLEIEGGETIEKELGQEYFEKEYTIKKKDIYGDKNIKEPLSVSATLCEYVKDKEGNRMLGETSDPVSYVINEGTAADTGDLIWAVDTIVYLTHEDNFEYCREYYENLEPCGTPGCVVVACTDTEYDIECDNNSCTLTTTSHPSSSSQPDVYKDVIKLPPAVFSSSKELDEWALKESKDAFNQYSVYTSETKEWMQGTGITFSDGKNYGSFEKNWPETAKDKAVFILIQGRLAVIYRAMDRKEAQSMSRKHVEMNVKEYFEKGDWR